MSHRHLFIVLVVLALVACADKDGSRATIENADPIVEPISAPAFAEVNPRLLRRFSPLKEDVFGAPSPALVELGRRLFHETRLSLNEDLSCNSCHDLKRFGVDGESTSRGTNGQRGGRNAPSVYNAAGYFVQFWDGRASNVEEQAKGPILNAAEMAMPSGDAVVARLKETAGYPELFAHAFSGEPSPITFDNVGRAIAAFERRLTTPSRWDAFLLGDTNALTPREREGLRTFLNVGCMVCHTGVLLGGTTFERVGVVEPWPNQKDVGRMAVTNAEADRMMFKVPTLRNVAETAPYFHDGSGKTLEDAVRLMGRHQLGLELHTSEVEAIATWLKSLTGTPPRELVEPSSTSSAHPALPGTDLSAAKAKADLASSSGPKRRDYPLQQWMKSYAQVALTSKTPADVARAFEAIERFGPAGYPRWSEITRYGAAAARAGDLEACRNLCKVCHDAYRERYRASDRARLLPRAP